MPSYVDPAKCDGCKGGDKTACMYICPNDLMVLNTEEMKAYNQEPDACWECYSCVKICPQGAIAVRGYDDFVPMGGQVHIKFRNGNIKRFKFPIRTTAEGSANAYSDEKGANLDDECLTLEGELKKPTMLA